MFGKSTGGNGDSIGMLKMWLGRYLLQLGIARFSCLGGSVYRVDLFSTWYYMPHAYGQKADRSHLDTLLSWTSVSAAEGSSCPTSSARPLAVSAFLMFLGELLFDKVPV
jgi:hypothetical protein